MKSGKMLVIYLIYAVIGVVLLGLGIGEAVDEFWTGMGTALVAVSAARLVRLYRFSKDESYREKVEVEASDERNRFLRNKAWAWAGYLFILIAAVVTIVLRVLGQVLLSSVVCYGMCLMLVLYWGAYLILRKKY